MPKTITYPIVLNAERAQSLAHYPHARRVGDLLFISGISSRKADHSHAGVIIHKDGRVEKNIEEQTEAVILNMQYILEQEGLSLDNLVDMSCFLVDMKDYAGFNRAYNQYFDQQTGPSRTTVGVKELPHPNLLIEIKGIAVY